MKILRNDYVDTLMNRRANGFVKILTGIRRCGKSYLLDTLFRERLIQDGVPNDCIVSIDLDAKEQKHLRNPILLDEFVRERTADRAKMYYVFIDEIQRSQKVLPDGIDLSRIAPEDREDSYVTFYDVLNGLRKSSNLDLYVTGSNSKTLSTDIATNFRDRGQQIPIRPFSFAEYRQTCPNLDGQQSFDRYLVWGGMPVAALSPDDVSRAAYLKGLFEEVYFKDIRERYGIRDDLVLSEIVDVLSSSVGSLTNPHNIGETIQSRQHLKPSDHTLKNYMDYLEDAFLFTKSRRFEIKGKRYIDSPFKFYAMDMGLRNARLNFRDTDRSHPMENVIYNELVSRGYSVDVGVVPISSYATGKQVTRQHEIDFVVNRGNDKIYIQSAWRMETPEKRRQETLPLRKSGDFFRKIVITDGYAEPQADEDGILHMGVLPFLLNRDILDDLMSKR